MPVTARHIVFVHGMLGWGPGELPLGYWGAATGLFDSKFNIHELKCGPVSSFHDRACELFAQLNGGDVDYGAAHSETAGHARFAAQQTRIGAKHGVIDNWSAENPIILIAHSAGAHSCLKLQQLLAEDFWGVGSSAGWIEAVISIAGVLNGSMLAYAFGCEPATGLLTGHPRRLIGATVEFARLVTGLTPGGIDLWLDHWSDLDRFVEGSDNLAYDMTLKGCRAANAAFHTHPETYYLALVTGMRRARPNIPFTQTPIPFLRERWIDMNILLRASASWQANAREFDVKPLPEWGSKPDLMLDAWRENDGAVSSISQRYPFTDHDEPVAEGGLMNGGMDKGRWRFERIENFVGRPFDHLDPVFGATLKPDIMPAHRELYRRLNELLR